MADLLDKAIRIAVNAHAGQLDKAGQPYILHPLRVMLACQTETERVVAVLHDVVEDSPVGLRLLRIADMPAEVLEAVDALSRRSGESQRSYYQRVKQNNLAIRVKIADLTDNMDERRAPEMNDYWRDKIAYYGKRRDEMVAALAIVLGEEDQGGM